MRKLKFATLIEAVDEARSLLDGGYIRQGNWNLGQICKHLRLVQDPSIDGYPRWMSFFAFLRPLTKAILLPKVLREDPPTGIRTLGSFQPGDTPDDAREVEKFAESVQRFLDHQGTYHAHPAFGRLDPAQLEVVHASHAAHHLRFLMPAREADDVSERVKTDSENRSNATWDSGASH
ncbi:MAG: DUF1569 domain-containing protein [Aureliella sp.]